MSDLPPPPPPSRAAPPPPPPPPPPPNLMVPPGYVGYTPVPMGAVALKRVGGVAKAMSVLIVTAAAAPIVELLVRRTVVDEADRYLAGSTSATDFTRSITGYLLVQAVTGVATVASAVLTMIWMYRVASNHRALHRGGTWGPGWAIGGWFAPPFLFVIPTLMLREMWKASDPAVPVGGEWRSGKGSPLPLVWFVLYGLVPSIALVLQSGDVFDQLGGSERTLAEAITADPTGDIVSAAVSVAAAIVFVGLARQLTDRHRRLTGENVR